MIDRIKIRSVSDGSAWGWGPMRIKKCLHGTGVVGILAVVSNALAAAEKYQVYLSAMPFNDATQPIMTGQGHRFSHARGRHAFHLGILRRLVGSGDESTSFIEQGPGNSRYSAR